MRYQGRITDWKDDKGFGFITPNGGGDGVFVHIRAFENRARRPVGNELVTYELETDARGRGRAGRVAFVGEKPVRAAGQTGRSVLPPVLTFCFVAGLGVATFLGKLPMALALLYLGASVVAFGMYAWDKAAAGRSGAQRTPENTLHLLGLAGGWPGALAAQRLLRHKSSKASFQSTYWGTVVLNCGALAWLLSPWGAPALAMLRGLTVG